MPGKWKSQGGINRSSKSNIVNNNIQTSTHFTPKNIGNVNTTIDNLSDINYKENSTLYNMQDSGTMNFNDVICYYPFNNINDSSFNNTNGIKNDSSNVLLQNNDNFSLITLSNISNGNNPIIIDTIFSQKAIEFRNNSNYLITKQTLNSSNAFGQTIDSQAISNILTLQTYIYIPDGTENLCIFALDDVYQSGLNNPDMNSDDANCFYLWFKGGSNNLQTQMYYYYRNDILNTPINITNDACGTIELNKWNKITFVFGGSYIALYINNKQTFQQSVGGGSFIPQKNFAINLGPRYNYSSGFDMINSSATNQQNNDTGAAFIDTRVILNAHSKEFIEYFSTSADGHQFVFNNIPNKENEISYLLSNKYSIVNTPFLCENDITTTGKHNSFGTNNFYAGSNFLDSVRFFSNVTFDKPVTYVVDSSVVNMWEIYSNGDITNSKKAALLIENAGGFNQPSSGNANFPSMLVYNSNNRITENTNTQNLVFSISGESVSIGEKYGTSNFNVTGSSNLNGPVTINGELVHAGNISHGGGDINTDGNVKAGNVTAGNVNTGNVNCDNVNAINVDSTNIDTTNIASTNINSTNITSTNITSTNIIPPINTDMGFGTKDALYAYDFNYSKASPDFQCLHIQNTRGGKGCISAIGFDTYTGRNASTEPPTQIRATDNAGWSQDLSFWTTPPYNGSGDGANANKAIERMCIDQNGNVGIGISSPSEKLEVNGNIQCEKVTETSDRRLKKNIVPTQHGLESILSLKPVSYMFKDSNDTTHLGFIAQDVENVLPELVNKTDPEKLALNYSGIIPVLTNAVKELNTKHEDELSSVKDKLASVKEELSSVKDELDELRDFKKEILARLEQLESNK